MSRESWKIKGWKTFSLWSSWRWDLSSFNLIQVKSCSSTCGSIELISRSLLPATSAHISAICVCMSTNSFILSFFFNLKSSKIGLTAESCSLRVPFTFKTKTLHLGTWMQRYRWKWKVHEVYAESKTLFLPLFKQWFAYHLINTSISPAHKVFISTLLKDKVNHNSWSSYPRERCSLSKGRNEIGKFSFRFCQRLMQVCFVLSGFLHLPSVNIKAFLLQLQKHFVPLAVTFANLIPYYLKIIHRYCN